MSQGRNPSACSSPGSARGLDFGDLPVPRLIVLKLEPARPPDFDALCAAACAQKFAGATLDDHRLWVSPALDHGQHHHRRRRSSLVVLVLVAAGLSRSSSPPAAPWPATARSSRCCISSAPTTLHRPASSSAASSGSACSGGARRRAALALAPDHCSRLRALGPGGRAPPATRSRPCSAPSASAGRAMPASCSRHRARRGRRRHAASCSRLTV